MITSFGDKLTEALYHNVRAKTTKRLPPETRTTALRKLDVLNTAHSLKDLRTPPGNRLQALKGDLRGCHSIRINDQWRIVFRWTGGDAHDVRITDYH